MGTKLVFTLWMFLVSISFLPAVALSSQNQFKKMPVIILKADDLQFNKQHAVHPNWKKFVSFIEEVKIKASIGIIGNSLEKGDLIYLKWIKTVHAHGNIEFWNHGYNHKKYGIFNNKTEFYGRSYSNQYKHLSKVQNLAGTKLGFKFIVFGSPYNKNDKNTVKVLEKFPEIAVWFFPEYTKGSKIPILKRYPMADIEVPNKKPNYTNFIINYPKLTNQKFIVLQLHPASWNKTDYNEFCKTIYFLKKIGCQFMTPSEYFSLSNK